MAVEFPRHEEKRKQNSAIVKHFDKNLQTVFGIHSVASALAANQVQQLWLNQNANERLRQLAKLAQQQLISVQWVAKAQLDQLVATENHQGVVALCRPLKLFTEKQLWQQFALLAQQKIPFYLALDGVTDPHNLGACLRSAEAFGVDGVILPKDRSSAINAIVRKTASGAAERLRLFQVTNLTRVLQEFQKRQVWVFGLAGEAEITIDQADFKTACLLVLGAEGKGLRRLTRSSCDQLLRLPMAGYVGSLNVAVATGIALFCVQSQRIKLAENH